MNLSYNYQFYNQFTNWHIIDNLQSKSQKTTDKQKLQHATIQPTGAHRGWNNRLQRNCFRCHSVWYRIETEASSYLADPDRSFGMLHMYPLVKSVFIHFNTTYLLQLRLNVSLVLADKLRQQDRTGCQTPTLKNFCWKLIPVMFEIEMLNILR